MFSSETCQKMALLSQIKLASSTWWQFSKLNLSRKIVWKTYVWPGRLESKGSNWRYFAISPLATTSADFCWQAVKFQPIKVFLLSFSTDATICVYQTPNFKQASSVLFGHFVKLQLSWNWNWNLISNIVRLVVHRIKVQNSSANGNEFEVSKWTQTKKRERMENIQLLNLNIASLLLHLFTIEK